MPHSTAQRGDGTRKPPVAVEQRCLQALNFGNGPLWSELERQEHQLMEQDCHQTALHTDWIGPGEEVGPRPGHSCALGLPLRSRRVDSWVWSRRKADDRIDWAEEGPTFHRDPDNSSDEEYLPPISLSHQGHCNER
ncbi:unnamed protein product [Gadus morhua 'NCC']